MDIWLTIFSMHSPLAKRCLLSWGTRQSSYECIIISSTCILSHAGRQLSNNILRPSSWSCDLPHVRTNSVAKDTICDPTLAPEVLVPFVDWSMYSKHAATMATRPWRAKSTGTLSLSSCECLALIHSSFKSCRTAQLTEAPWLSGQIMFHINDSLCWYKRPEYSFFSFTAKKSFSKTPQRNLMRSKLLSLVCLWE